MTNNRTIGSGFLAFVICILACTLPAVAQKSTNKPLLEMTTGHQVKVVWQQTKGESREEGTLKYYDSKKGEIKSLPFYGSGLVVFTSDGRYILSSVGKTNQRQIMAFDTKTEKIIKFPKGPRNNLMAVWTDPKTKKTWVYVNDYGEDPKKKWRNAAGPIHRFPFDAPDKRELFWDRTRSHMYLSLSEDGRRACLAILWSYIGQMINVYGADGKLDQEKSTWKMFGGKGGCFPAIAPDNSYRQFRLTGKHNAIDMIDADGKNPRRISITGMSPPKGVERKKPTSAWLTLWSTHPQYMTCMAPEHGPSQIYIGRFDPKFTKIEKWVLVSNPKDGKCWRSHAWVAPEK